MYILGPLHSHSDTGDYQISFPSAFIKKMGLVEKSKDHPDFAQDLFMSKTRGCELCKAGSEHLASASRPICPDQIKSTFS